MSDSNVVTLSHSSGSTAKVHLFGGTVFSWVCQGKENLFVSKISKMDGSKAVRGGIPLVFRKFTVCIYKYIFNVCKCSIMLKIFILFIRVGKRSF